MECRGNIFRNLAYSCQEILTKKFTEAFNRTPGRWVAYTTISSENVVMLIPHCPSDLTHSMRSLQGKEEKNLILLYFRLRVQFTNLVGHASCKPTD